MMLLVWWTNQADCEAIGERLPKGLPVYLRDQYRSRYGRNGRGRLWTDDQFGGVQVSPWPDTKMGAILSETPRLGQTYAGIVIREQDAPMLDEMPGLITTLELKRYRHPS